MLSWKVCHGKLHLVDIFSTAVSPRQIPVTICCIWQLNNFCIRQKDNDLQYNQIYYTECQTVASCICLFCSVIRGMTINKVLLNLSTVLHNNNKYDDMYVNGLTHCVNNPENWHKRCASLELLSLFYLIILVLVLFTVWFWLWSIEQQQRHCCSDKPTAQDWLSIK